MPLPARLKNNEFLDAVTTNDYAALILTNLKPMKDQRDNKTMDLLRSKSTSRQAAFKERQTAMGRRQRPLWLTDAEFEAIKNFLESMRDEKS